MYNQSVFNISDLLYGSYIKYDKLYEMTKYAFYGKTDSNTVDIYIDTYSILKTLYSKGSSMRIDNSYSIASCLINLAIHLRAYFESRHNVMSRIFIIYGGARPKEAFVNYYRYNEKNMLMEDSDTMIKMLIMDNLEVMNILCPYLHDIFCIVDLENEFSVIASSLIDKYNTPNIIYSKEPLAYQLVAFKPMTFLYRPKKSMSNDISWVVTKSTLYNAYRNGELKLKKQLDISLDPLVFSIYQSISGVRSRSMNALLNANTSMKFIYDAISTNVFSTGYNANAIFCTEPNPFDILCENSKVDPFEVINRFAAIDLIYQTSLYNNSIKSKEVMLSITNLYDPQTVRNINDKYFDRYPLDLNRV